MDVALATVGDAPWSRDEHDVYVEMARTDSSGEHRLTNDASTADVILFVDLHQHPGDPKLRALDAHPLVRRYPERIRVIDLRDRPFFTYPGVYISWAAGARGSALVRGGCYPRLHTSATAQSETEPDLLFSFLGALTHPVRSRLLALRHPRGLAEDTSQLNFFDRAESDQARLDAQSYYRHVSARSKFVLCPRGHGLSSFRLFETLSAGRVPVIISDDWTPPPGPTWSSCSVRVPERDAARVPEILEAIEDQWVDMARGANECWLTYFAEDRRWHHYVETLSSLTDGVLRAPWLQRERIRLSVLDLRARAYQRTRGVLDRTAES